MVWAAIWCIILCEIDNINYSQVLFEELEQFNGVAVIRMHFISQPYSVIIFINH
jgi:hypothetical protein